MASLAEQIMALGAHKAAEIPVANIPFDRSFRTLCESNACGNYGVNWKCPPDAGDIDALIEEAQGFDTAVVYQTVGQLEDSYDFEGMTEAAQRQNELTQAVRREFAALPFAKILFLGAGGCPVCETCAKRTAEPCRFPDLAMASLETYGISVSQLASRCGMRYINGENTVTYFGAFLYKE